jgi:flavodoxin
MRALVVYESMYGNTHLVAERSRAACAPHARCTWPRWPTPGTKSHEH